MPLKKYELNILTETNRVIQYKVKTGANIQELIKLITDFVLGLICALRGPLLNALLKTLKTVNPKVL